MEVYEEVEDIVFLHLKQFLGSGNWLPAVKEVGVN